MKIPATRPLLGDDERDALLRALDDRHLVGNGAVSRRVQRQLEQMVGVRHALLTPSCTAALEMAMLVLGIGPGDEVILPSFTFVSTANCVVLRGARPVFAEIRPDTLNIDPADIERRITPRTRAIIPVHYAGVACEMDAILDIAAAHDLAVVEDAAQGVDARYKGRALGTIGDIGCYSFHATKNITCGEGGAFLTNDDALAERAEIIHEKGTNRAAFVRGQVDKYTWVSAGSSYVLSDLLAALLEAQLARREEIRSRRELIWQTYFKGLTGLAKQEKVILPVVPPGVEQNYHLFYFRVADQATRDALLDDLRGAGIGATFHYVPLHSSPFGRQVLGCEDELPITEQVSRTLIRLPLYPEMSEADAEAALDRVHAFFASR